MSSDPARRVVLFDLDGCILDSTEPILQCLNAALVELELGSITRYDLSRYVGPPLQWTVEALLAERQADPMLAQPLIDAYRSYYRTASIELAVTYPGIAEAIAELAPTERLAVCTSKPQQQARPILDHLDLSRHFEVIGGPNLTEAESKLDTMARVLDEMAPLDLLSSVMIGDRHHDIDAATHHGLRSIGVTWGFGSRPELEEAGATEVIDHPDQLGPLLGAVLPA